MSNAGDSPERRGGYRRKRVAKACHTCRAMKSKCDGKRPECGRCRGYGYLCGYSGSQQHSGTITVQGHEDLRKAMDEYADLAGRLASKLPSSKERQGVSSAISRIKSRANAALASIAASSEGAQPTTHGSQRDVVGPSPVSRALRSERYLGEVSDVQFFNLVKRILQTQSGSSCPEPEVDSYEQDDDIAWGNTADASRTVQLPGPDGLKSLTDIYFSTIHLAYPFIPGSMFTRYLDGAQSLSDSSVSLDATHLALLHVICAISAYYNSFPSNSHAKSDRIHELYFLRALSLTPSSGVDRSIDYVALLLAQCFYFLAVCRTDSCWTTLGQAVRTAQSIGLHVELQGRGKSSGPCSLENERRRRVWYSIYVLDRLLSLQLGRPPAIHDGDCDVPLPSPVADCDIDWDADVTPRIPEGPSSGDYFLAVISFSKVVGDVLTDLYSPKTSHGPPYDLTDAGLYNTKELDQKLTMWKLELPRPLRFDLGHAFDQSLAFKRQRNMLAVKYHHLRALIHRPYLCYPLLRNMETSSSVLTQSNWPQVSVYEKICITEARAIARLLHNISSEKDLVHDFPWWQMISCLICAGSILLVSSIFTQQKDETGNLDAESLSDDAETCLRVFEALSINSEGARIARDMMGKLKESGIQWKQATSSSGDQNRLSAFSAFPGSSTLQGTGPVPTTISQAPELLTMDDQDASLEEDAMPTADDWPAEIIDSMAWSAQFFEAFHPGQ